MASSWGADEWSVSRSTAVAVAAAPVVGGVLVAAAAANRTLYRTIVREDALLEWAQAAAWAAAVVAAVVLVRRRTGWARVWWVVFALGALAALGEELSWGQRLLDFGTPGALRDADKQEEAALHNVSALEAPTRLAIAAVAGAAVVGAWTTRRVPRFLVPGFALAAGYELVRLAAGDNPGYGFAKWAEWPETCFAGGLAGIAVLSLRR